MTTPRAALIAGPTASGKSAIAIALAQSLMADGHSAVIINADASQVYADIPILSAQPDAAERCGIAHHLFGTWDGATACNAADWAAAAADAIAQAHDAGQIPILVGGTGLYLRTLLDGIAPVPAVDPDVRDRVRAMASSEAHTLLMQHDLTSAQKLHPSDSTRVARALEVVLSTAKPLHEWQQQRVGGIGQRINLSALVLLPPREWLRARCDQRFDAMMARGAQDEVAALLARHLDPALPVMRAIGVPEIAAYLRGEISIDEAHDRAKAATRQYAKRQYTWFRHQPPPTWERLDSELNDDICAQIVIKLRNLLLTS